MLSERVKPAHGGEAVHAPQESVRARRVSRAERAVGRAWGAPNSTNRGAGLAERAVRVEESMERPASDRAVARYAHATLCAPQSSGSRRCRRCHRCCSCSRQRRPRIAARNFLKEIAEGNGTAIGAMAESARNSNGEEDRREALNILKKIAKFKLS